MGWWYWNFMPMSRFVRDGVTFYTNFNRSGVWQDCNRLTFRNATGIRFFGRWYVPVFFWRTVT